MDETSEREAKLIEELGALRASVAELKRVEAELREAQEALRATQEMHRQILSAESDAIITFDGDTLQIQDANDAALELYGYGREEFLDLRATDISAEPERTALDTERALEEGSHTIPRRYHRKRDGTVFPVEISAAPFEAQGRRMLCEVIRDVTVRRWAQEELFRVRAAVDGATDAILIVDLNGKAIYMNSAFRALFGHTLERLNEAGIDSIFVDDAAGTQILATVQKGQDWTGELQAQSRRGREFPVFLRGSAVRDAEREVIDILLICTDITERKRAEDQLLYEATHDSLTGVFSRRYLMEQLRGAVESAKRYGYPLTLCLCDVDGFKAVNDVHGHAVGDEVLAKFGRLIRSETRSVDMPGRYGGDEFCIVLPQTAVGEAKECIERLRARLEKEVYRGEGGTTFSVTGTFGLAGLDAERTTDKDLLASADQALYQAKGAGGNRTVVKEST